MASLESMWAVESDAEEDEAEHADSEAEDASDAGAEDFTDPIVRPDEFSDDQDSFHDVGNCR